MPCAGRAAIIVGMHANHDLTRRVLVPVAGSPAASSKAPRVRHFRMARVPLHMSPEPMPDRFAHLRRSYD